jgi:hypothetical protein
MFDIDYNVDPTTPPVGGSGLTVALNAGTPAAQNIPDGVEVEFVKFNLTAAADGAVNVSSIDLTAYGLSDAENIDNITFYVDGSKVGTSRDMGSDRVRTFNFPTPINIPAGTTETITVKANILADETGTYGLGIDEAADILAGNATVSGSFPISGNLMSAVESNVGSITVAGVDQSVTANFGEEDVLLADFSLEVATENALLETIRLYNGGTNVNDIVSNLKMYIDGEEVAEGEYADRYATFDINNFEIEKGDTVLVEVRGDMGITNVDNTVKLYFRDSNDITAMGKTHGFNLSIDRGNLDAVTGTGVTQVKLEAGDFTIGMDKSSSTGTPAKDVKPDDDKVVLATLNLQSNSEDATVREMTFGVTIGGTQSASSTSDLIENVELVDLSTGGVYDLSFVGDDVKTSEDIFLTNGVTKKFNIRADVKDVAEEDTTLYMTLAGGDMTIEGDVSGVGIDTITPTSVSGAIITIKVASLDLEVTTLNSVSAVGGASDVLVYKGLLEAGTADDIRLQSVKFTTYADDDDTFTNSNITKLELFVDGNLVRSLSNSIIEATGAGDTINFTSLNPSYRVISAGEKVPVEVKATFASTLSPVGLFSLKVNAIGDLVSRADSTNDLVDATIESDSSRDVTTVATGQLKVEMLTNVSKTNRDAWLLAGSQTDSDRYMGELKFTTQNEAIQVTKLVLEKVNGDATNADIEKIMLVDSDDSVIAYTTVDSSGDVSFDPFNITFEADKSTSLFIAAEAKGINVADDPTSTATDNRSFDYKINDVEAKGFDSGNTIEMTGVDTTDMTWDKFDYEAISKKNYIVGSKLNTVVNNLSDGTLTGGSNKVLGEYKFTFDNGDNRTSSNDELKAILSKLKVTFDKSDGVELSSVKLQVNGSGPQILATTTDGIGTSASTTGWALWDATALQGLDDSAKVNGEVTVTITGSVVTASDDYVQTSIAGLDTSADFNYFSNGVVGGNNQANMYLPITTLSGGTLSN